MAIMKFKTPARTLALFARFDLQDAARARDRLAPEVDAGEVAGLVTRDEANTAADWAVTVPLWWLCELIAAAEAARNG